MKICIATENKGKLREIQALLSSLPVEPVTAGMLGLQIHAVETGSTYAENAEIKARLYQQTTGLLTLADDSGLEVAALNGAPGLYSARYHPKPDATDADRRQFLLEQLAPYPQPWKARFTCAVCLIHPDGHIWHTAGTCKGRILSQELGENGFGYDPIFEVEGKTLTMAQLEEEEKNRISHRARAVRAMLPVLERLL